MGSLKSDMGNILGAMEKFSKRQEKVQQNQEKSLAARDHAIKELKSRIKNWEEDQENSLLSQVRLYLSIIRFIT